MRQVVEIACLSVMSVFMICTTALIWVDVLLRRQGIMLGSSSWKTWEIILVFIGAVFSVAGLAAASQSDQVKTD